MTALGIFAQAEVIDASTELEWGILVISLFGGLALFLYGMDQMTDALKLVAGDRMRSVLQRLTGNRFTGLLTGAGVTAVIQSSSVTTVLVVGFISSGLMTLQESVAVIVGANIGTTVTAQIIAFKVTEYALLLVAFGFAVTAIAKRPEKRSWGAVIMGLGLIFFGMAVMSDAMSPLRTYQPFIDAMVTLEAPLVGILVGALFTALVQSSSATTGLVIVMAGQGLITLDAGIALILGANVGTSVTALLAAIGKPREALRSSVVHTLFNVIGVLIWLPFVGAFSDFLGGSGGDVPRQIANAHTIFNVANAFIFIWFTSHIATVVTRLVRDRPEAEEAAIKARYLDKELLRTPSLAIDRARLELLRMADRVRSMYADILPALFDGPRSAISSVVQMDDEVDALYGYIITYLGQISQSELGERDTNELMGLMEATNNLESIGDIIETNLAALAFRRIEDGVTISAETRERLTEFHGVVQSALDQAMVAVTQRNRSAATAVSSMKKEINSLEKAAMQYQAERLVADEPNRLEAYRIEMDLIADLKRIYYFSKRTARAAVPVEERTSD